jgi:hypothetical protein
MHSIRQSLRLSEREISHLAEESFDALFENKIYCSDLNNERASDAPPFRVVPKDYRCWRGPKSLLPRDHGSYCFGLSTRIGVQAHLSEN